MKNENDGSSKKEPLISNNDSEAPTPTQYSSGNNHYNSNTSEIKITASNDKSDTSNTKSKEKNFDEKSESSMSKEKILTARQQNIVDRYAPKSDGFLNANIFSRLFFYWAYRIIRVT